MVAAPYARTRRWGARRVHPDVRLAAGYAIDPETDCHIWERYRNKSGYGRFWVNGRATLTHVYAYERKHGPVPVGMELDHFKCSNRACCNPDHLRPATRRENVLRSSNPAAMKAAQTHCKHGHEFTPENTITSSGNRQCRRCQYNANRRWERENPEKVRAARLRRRALATNGGSR